MLQCQLGHVRTDRQTDPRTRGLLELLSQLKTPIVGTQSTAAAQQTGKAEHY